MKHIWRLPECCDMGKSKRQPGLRKCAGKKSRLKTFSQHSYFTFYLKYLEASRSDCGSGYLMTVLLLRWRRRRARDSNSAKTPHFWMKWSLLDVKYCNQGNEKVIVKSQQKEITDMQQKCVFSLQIYPKKSSECLAVFSVYMTLRQQFNVTFMGWNRSKSNGL